MRLKFLMTGLAAAILLTACGKSEKPAAAADAPKAEAKAGLNGAGSSFIAPLFSKWAAEYNKTGGDAINYQSVGSSAGIDQIKKKTVDFGASDAPLSADELKAEGLVQFPTAIGGVVAVYNVKGIDKALTFDGQVLGDIYLMKIKKWNDPAIAKLNPGVALPDQAITVVRRSDGSGTSHVFTEFLSKSNTEWKTIGANKSPKWAEGTVGGKGNEGVAASVKQFDGSIGYVEYIYGKKNNMTVASMVNKAGKTVEPSAENFAAAASKADWSIPGMGASLTFVDGDKSWPITGTAFALMHAKQDKPENGAKILKYFDWSFTNGQAIANELSYIPLPAEVVALIKQEWKKITDASGKALM